MALWNIKAEATVKWQGQLEADTREEAVKEATRCLRTTDVTLFYDLNVEVTEA